MSYIILGFITGMSLILAIGAQNIFVIEQGLKKEFVFIVCLICSISDFLLIFIGIFIFYYFESFFTPIIELVLNLLLLVFILHFIWGKIRQEISKINLKVVKTQSSIILIILKTLGFTFLNPHVYSDTVFFLGNFSKNFILPQKISFGLGASLASIIFFFSIGYASNYFSKYLNNQKIWKIINWIIIIIMTFISLYILYEVIKSI